MTQTTVPAALDRARWGIALRGAVSIALGILILARRLDSVAAFVLVIAFWALASGLIDIVHAFDLRPYLSEWWAMLVGGIISAGIGVAALYYYPGLSLAFAVIGASAWLLVTGVVTVYLAFSQRQLEMPWRWTMAFGLLSVAASVLALVYQNATLATIMRLFSAFGIVGGVVLLIGAAKLRS